jgi:hypothetical protein
MTAAEVPTRLGSVERQREDEHTDQQGIKPTSHGSTSVTSGAAPKAPRSRHANSPPEARQTNGSHRAGPGRGRPTARPSRPARSGLGRGRTGAESAAGRSGSSRSGLPRDRACRPPANGVEHCETDADLAADAIRQRSCGTAAEPFRESGSTQRDWHLRRNAATGRSSTRDVSSPATPPLQPTIHRHARPSHPPQPAWAVCRAGEALRTLGGFRGRRERARVPSTAGSPSRLCISPARPSRPSAAFAVGGNAQGFPRPRARHHGSLASMTRTPPLVPPPPAPPGPAGRGRQPPGCVERRRGPPGPRRLTRSEGTRKGSLDRGLAITARSHP